MSETQETIGLNPRTTALMGVIPKLIRLWLISSRWGSSWIATSGDFITASGGSCGSQSRPTREKNSASCAGKTEPNNVVRDTGTMNTHILPTSDEIDAVVFDMIAAEAAQVPDDTSLDELWSSVALDLAGEFRGYGFGHTPAEARAFAWVTAWWPECDLRAVPRVVPEGWTFEIYSPGEGPVFRRTTHRYGDVG